MTERLGSSIDDHGSDRQRMGSRIVQLASLVLKEIGWALWQTCASGGRIVATIWIYASQRRLNTRRSRILEEVGKQIRHSAVSEDSGVLVAACIRYEDEVNRDRESAKAAPGCMSRVASRIRLTRAESRLNEALRTLGEHKIGIAPPEQQTALRDVEAAIARRQVRRTQLWETWRSLNVRRRIEIVGGSAVLVGVAIFLSAYFRKPRSEDVTQTVVRNQSEAVSDDAATQMPTKREQAEQFAKDRKVAGSGDWLVFPGNPILQRGELNAWDDFKVGAPIVMKEGDRFRMWYRACHFVMTEYTCAIGHATSKDGVTWEKSSAPVFIPDNSHERERLDSVAVLRARDQYWMWYTVRPDQFNGHPYATVHLAISADGLAWRSGVPVLRGLSEYTDSIEPAAYYDGKLFHLWYTDYPADDAPALLHLTSSDGTQWQTAGSTSLSDLKITTGRLSVVSDGHEGYRAYYAYSGQDRSVGVFGVLDSSNGDQWQRAQGQPKLPFEDLQAYGRFPLAPSALPTNDGLWVWYALQPRNGAEEIGIAFLKEKAL